MFTSKETKILNQILASAVDKNKALSVDGVHGYLFGLAIIPETIMPSEWLPMIIGDDMGIADEDEEHRLLQGLFAIYNRIMSEEHDGKLTFPFDISSITTKDIPRIRQWAKGLFLSLNHRPEIWGLGGGGETEGLEPEDENLSADEAEVLGAWAVLMGVAFPHRIPELCGDNGPYIDETKREAQLFAHLPTAVENLRRHAAAGAVRGRPVNYPASPQPRRAEKVGRNDPCPCGSGSKYKKCCGK